MAEEKLGGVKILLKSASEKKKLSAVCLTFFGSAGARDLGLMTLFTTLHRKLVMCYIS